ncbi:Ras-related small GTPase, Rho type [Pseudoloma neurophilia]|uniref:Ras-related small GTPase, Rho type n=1 Tax=Pseudoloma neurophilia TaxID=146866 RepID=A0A0R0LXP7_9MICR|nr:Ras-related small GTPase, Rho type [Pseudoloma neurophilia]
MDAQIYDNQKKVTGKIVVVGDGACGKTCLLEVFKRNKFPEEYIPTVVDNFVKDVTINEQETVCLTLWDTAGQEDYDSVRPLSYKDTDIVVLCYTIENSNVLCNIPNKWVLEVKNYCPTAKYILVGLKSDLREDPEVNQEGFVSREQGENLANEIGALEFYECSAKTGTNVDEIFINAAKYIAEYRKQKKEKISLFQKIFCCKFCC